jgi:ABC1 atypical kinase-like domain
MTAGRLAPLIVSQRWSSLHRRTAVFSTGAIVLLGAAATTTTESSATSAWPRLLDVPVLQYSSFITECQDSKQISLKESTSPATFAWGPSLEALGRALRLVRTALHIVWDYEVAKLERSLPFSNQISQKDSAIHALEAEVEQKEKALEEAQNKYARDDDDNNNAETSSTTNSKESRQEIKRQQKLRMQEAAQELADAEAKLATMEGQSSKSALHRKSAQRLLQLCRDNGGVYIKVGQHLANLDYLIPQEYITVLSSLFNEAPQSPFEDVAKVIQEDLGAQIDELFDHFDPVPIASASLAQVHVAYDKQTKQKLAVKVQHRGLRETSAGDIHAVCFVVSFIDKLFQDFTFGWIADEMAPQLPKELDFTKEGKNAEKAAADMEDSGLACCIPKIIWKDTSARVLTMKFEEGFKSTDIDAIQAAGLKKR